VGKEESAGMKLNEEDILLDIVKDHLSRHPGFKVEDLYKLIFQAACGSAHYVGNRKVAERQLRREWEDGQRIPKGETLIEIIDPRMEKIRINLRLYKKIGGDLKTLVDVFIKSAEMSKMDRGRLFKYWDLLSRWSLDGEVPFSIKDIQNLWKKVKSAGFPPGSHSDEYLNANRPAYRVVLKSLWLDYVNI